MREFKPVLMRWQDDPDGIVYLLKVSIRDSVQTADAPTKGELSATILTHSPFSNRSKPKMRAVTTDDEEDYVHLHFMDNNAISRKGVVLEGVKPFYSKDQRLRFFDLADARPKAQTHSSW